MDKARIILISVAVVVIIGFTIYTFGSYSSTPKAGTKVQPINEVVSTSSNVVSSGNNSNSISQHKMTNSTSGTIKTMNTFANHDKIENYYSIQFPNSAIVEHGKDPGSFIAKLPEGKGTFYVNLVDIPDTSNVQLYMLTQDEPSLKSSLQQYTHVSSNQSSISGNRAWDFEYTWNNSTMPMESKKTFIEGADNAAVIIFSSPREMFEQLNNSTANNVLQSFRWIVR